jgi:hypothetical protein
VKSIAGAAARAACSLGPRGRILLLGALATAALAVVAALPPIPQDPAYHDFADRRPVLGVPNGLDVASNLGFLLVGVLGLRFGLRPARLATCCPERWERHAVLVLFASVAATGIGSTYYHLVPGNERLVWDRLPMAFAFMALFALVIGDRIGPRTGQVVLVPLLVAGAASVVGWHLGERVGAGDLRGYVLVQFLPMLAVPAMLAFFPARYTGGRRLAVVIAIYAVAKAFEAGDRLIFTVAGVSGHTLKHLVASLATWQLLVAVTTRRPVDVTFPWQPAGSDPGRTLESRR